MDDTKWTQPVPYVYPSGYQFDPDINKETYKKGVPSPSGFPQIEPTLGSNDTAFPDYIYWPPYDKYWREIYERLWRSQGNWAVTTLWGKTNIDCTRLFASMMPSEYLKYLGNHPIFPSPAYSMMVYYNNSAVYLADINGNVLYTINESVDMVLGNGIMENTGFALILCSGNKIKFFNIIGKQVGGEITTIGDVKYATLDSGNLKYGTSSYLVCTSPHTGIDDFQYSLSYTTPMYITPEYDRDNYVLASDKLFSIHRDEITTEMRLSAPIKQVSKDSLGVFGILEDNLMVFLRTCRTNLYIGEEESGIPAQPPIKTIFAHSSNYTVYGEKNLDMSEVIDGSYILYLRTKKQIYLTKVHEYTQYLRPVITIGSRFYKLKIKWGDIQENSPYTLENAPILLEYDFGVNISKVSQNRKVIYVLTSDNKVHCFRTLHYSWARQFSDNVVDICLDRLGRIHISFLDRVEIYDQEGNLKHISALNNVQIKSIPATFSIGSWFQRDMQIGTGIFKRWENWFSKNYNYTPILMSEETLLGDLGQKIYGKSDSMFYPYPGWNEDTPDNEREYMTLYDYLLHEMRLLAQRYQAQARPYSGGTYIAFDRWGEDQFYEPLSCYVDVLGANRHLIPSGLNMYCITRSSGKWAVVRNKQVIVRKTTDEFLNDVRVFCDPDSLWDPATESMYLNFAQYWDHIRSFTIWNGHIYGCVRMTVNGRNYLWLARYNTSDGSLDNAWRISVPMNGERHLPLVWLKFDGYDAIRCGDFITILHQGDSKTSSYKMFQQTKIDNYYDELGPTFSKIASESANNINEYLVFLPDQPNNRQCKIEKHTISVLHEGIDTSMNGVFDYEVMFSPKYDNVSFPNTNTIIFYGNRHTALWTLYRGIANWAWTYSSTHDMYLYPQEFQNRWIGKQCVVKLYTHWGTDDNDPATYDFAVTNSNVSSINVISENEIHVNIDPPANLPAHWSDAGEKHAFFIFDDIHPTASTGELSTILERPDNDYFPNFFAEGYSSGDNIQKNFDRG